MPMTEEQKAELSELSRQIGTDFLQLYVPIRDRFARSLDREPEEALGYIEQSKKHQELAAQIDNFDDAKLELLQSLLCIRLARHALLKRFVSYQYKYIANYIDDVERYSGYTLGTARTKFAKLNNRRDRLVSAPDRSTGPLNVAVDELSDLSKELEALVVDYNEFVTYLNRELKVGGSARDQISRAYVSANLIILSAATLSILITNQVVGRLEELQEIRLTGSAFLTQLHWLVSIVAMVSLFVGVSYCYCRFIQNYLPSLGVVLRIPSWVQLRSFGDKRLAKVSYVAIAIIPIVAATISTNPFNVELFAKFGVPLNLKISFFISIFFAFALTAFLIACPPQLKNESDTTTELQYYDEAIDSSRLGARAVCWLFYALGLTFSLILLIRASITVIYA